MKSVKIKSDRLAFRDASLILGEKLKVVKISFEQAMAFRRNKFSSFEEMAAYYGNQILKEGEFYKGYVALYRSYKQEVIYLDGILTKVKSEGINEFFMPYHDIQAAKEGILWKIEYPANRKQGSFRYVWNFGDCSFDAWITYLQGLGKLPKEDAEKKSEGIKEKLIQSLITNSSAELSDEEFLVVQSYAPDYFRLFFSEV